ncbi:MAG: type II secretion system F family protein [Candidatus Micrarchaeota archaeon]
MLNNLVAIGRYFPPLNLIKINHVEDSKRYGTMALFVSLVLATLVFTFSDLVASIVAFSFIFIIIAKMPQMEYERRNRQMEAEMPFMLRSIGTLLNMNIPFKKAMEMSAVSDSYLDQEIQAMCLESEHGIPISKAINSMARQMKSNDTRTALSQLITAYETGGKGNEIRRIANDMLSKQRHRIKEYVSASSIFGLLFIASSALLPTFFVIVSSLGSSPLGIETSGFSVRAIMLLIIPLISLLILQLMKMNEPVQVFERKNNDKRFAIILLPILGYIVFPEIGYLFLGATIAVCIAIFYPTYSKEKRIEGIENALPNALMASSSLPKSATLEEVFNVFENEGMPLSEEAEISLRQLKSNMSEDKVLDDFKERNKGPLVERVANALKHSLDCGNVKRINETAEDLLEFNSISNERKAMVSMQKYTLFFGVLLIPMILKSVTKILDSIGETLLSNTGTIHEIQQVIPAYIIIYAALVSYYSSDIDKKRSSLFIYFSILSILGIAAYYFIDIF